MSIPGKFAALILAAGYSSRMGAFKPLLPLGESTVISESVELFSKAGIKDIRIVVGFRADEIKEVLTGQGVTWIVNPDYDKGMLSSILAGVKSLDPKVEAFFLLPADIPLVRSSTIVELMEAYEKNTPRVVYPRFRGLLGHPPLISKECITEGLSSDYPGGLRAFLGRYEKDALYVDVADQGIVMDCDTPEEYRKIKEHKLRDSIPTEAECNVLAERFGLPERIILHSRLVAELARVLAVHLKPAGLNLNLELIEASGRLHDLAKGKPDHARAGGEALRKLGFSRVAEVVASHMDIRVEQRPPDEADLIYLADKYVRDNRIVSLTERFTRSLERYAGRPDIVKEVRKRFENAEEIRKRIEKYLGRSIESIISSYERSIFAVALQRPREIYLVRHGAIGAERKGTHYIGQLDLPLNLDGTRRAGELAEMLNNIDISSIYCSDLKRSLKTAETIARPHGLQPIVRRELREINLGEWEGLSFDEVRKRDPKGFEERGRNLVHFTPPGGENFLECGRRVIGVFYDILHSSKGNILIVGHAGVNRILLAQALGKPLDQILQIDQDYGCWNVIRCSGFSLEVTVLNAERIEKPVPKMEAGSDYREE
ncbi:MAG: DVU_1551 family NTP transferase [Syntrophobacteraceae bacterium]